MLEAEAAAATQRVNELLAVQTANEAALRASADANAATLAAALQRAHDDNAVARAFFLFDFGPRTHTAAAVAAAANDNGALTARLQTAVERVAALEQQVAFLTGRCNLLSFMRQNTLQVSAVSAAAAEAAERAVTASRECVALSYSSNSATPLCSSLHPC
jgi:hypothetical protein